MGNLYMQELHPNKTTTTNLIWMEEVVTAVVHPVTKETITRYKKLSVDPC